MTFRVTQNRVITLVGGQLCVGETPLPTLQEQVRTSYPAHHSSHPAQTFKTFTAKAGSKSTPLMSPSEERELQKQGLLCDLITKMPVSQEV